MDEYQHDFSKINKIAFASSRSMGDYIVSIPILRKLREIYPTAQINYLTVKTPHRALFLECPYIDSIIEFNNKNFGNLFLDIIKMRKIKFDLVIAPFPSRIPTKILTKSIRTKYLVESKSDIFGSENIIEKSFFTLSSLNIEIKANDRGLEWPFPIKDYKEKIDFILSQNNVKQDDLLVGIHVGAKKGIKTRFWPITRWTEVINYLRKEYKANIVFVGGKEDINETQKIIKLMNPPLINLVGKLSIKESGALINKCDLFISTNSGPMWIAAALHKPQITLCGPSQFHWDPYNDKAIIIRKIIDRKHCDPPCDAKKCRFGDNLCMKSIGFDDVKRAIDKIIRNITLYDEEK